MYADCITFEPLGSQSITPAPAHSPSDVQFHGYPCSPREVVSLARKVCSPPCFPMEFDLIGTACYLQQVG